MRVQHPNKTEHSITPSGLPAIVTDEHGVAEVPDNLGENLVEQGWINLKSLKPEKE